MKITLINVWIGKWFPWLDLYLESCRWNPNFNWILFNDYKKPRRLPQNVKYVSISLDDIRRLANEKLNRAYPIPTGYKLCDFKPTYGLLFEDYLRDSDYWAYCDMDLFWGELESFLPDSFVSQYDIITSTRCSIVGQLTLMRNCLIVNNLFKKVPDYEQLLSKNKNHQMAETNLDKAAIIAEKNGDLKVLRRQFQNWEYPTHPWVVWVQSLDKNSSQKTELRFGAHIWNAGSIRHINSGKEALFFHFLDYKQEWKLTYPYRMWSNITGWIIDESGIKIQFKNRQKFWTIAYVLVNSVPWYLFRLLARCYNNVRALIKRILPRSIVNLIKAR